MKKTNISTTTYQDGDFCIDIVAFPENYYEAWIYKKDIGVKDLMFGMHEESYDLFLDIVDVNLEEYEESYEEDHAV